MRFVLSLLAALALVATSIDADAQTRRSEPESQPTTVIAPSAPSDALEPSDETGDRLERGDEDDREWECDDENQQGLEDELCGETDHL